MKYFGINKVFTFDYEVFEFDDLNEANEWAKSTITHATGSCFRYVVKEEHIKDELELLRSDKAMMDKIYNEFSEK